MYSRDQMSAENSRSPGFKGTFPRGPKETVQISLQIIGLRASLSKDCFTRTQQARWRYGYILFCFDFPNFEFSPQKITYFSICSNKPSFPIQKLFWSVHCGEKRFEQSDLTALARTEPHCSAACSQEQTTGKTVGPNSHLLQIGRLPAYATLQNLPYGVSHFYSILVCIFMCMMSLTQSTQSLRNYLH